MKLHKQVRLTYTGNHKDNIFSQQNDINTKTPQIETWQIQ